tara:strand:- start:59 stop:412 length:354 start_codon:yes stop_codon:yes gene_type:complete
MKDQLSRHLDPHNKDNNFLSSLSIFIDKEGLVYYDASWQKSSDGLFGMASIFYKLIVENLSEDILNNLQDLEKELDDESKRDMEEIEKLLIQISGRSDSISADISDLVVPPDVIIHM